MASQRIENAVKAFRKTKEEKKNATLSHRQAIQELVAALSDEGVPINDLVAADLAKIESGGRL